MAGGFGWGLAAGGRGVRPADGDHGGGRAEPRGDSDAGAPPPDPLGAGRTVRALRALSGSIAAGLVLVTIGVVVVSILGGTRGIPGPGTESVTVHLVAAVAALGLQRFSDRGRGFVAGLCSCAVFAVAFGVLWTQWWG